MVYYPEPIPVYPRSVTLVYSAEPFLSVFSQDKIDAEQSGIFDMACNHVRRHKSEVTTEVNDGGDLNEIRLGKTMRQRSPRSESKPHYVHLSSMEN